MDFKIGERLDFGAVMDLKSRATIWSRSVPAGTRSENPGTTAVQASTCDVAVVGGGVSGALIAHALIEAGADVIVVDRRPAATGSTSASTALLLYETDLSLGQLARRHGWRHAVRTYQLGRDAVGEIGGIVRRLKIDCGFEKKRSLYLASDRAGLAEIKSEYRRRRRAGFQVKLLDRPELARRFGLDFDGALYSPGAAQIDPVRFTRGLLAHHLRRSRLRFYRGAELIRFQTLAAGVRLHLRGGKTIAATRLVFAPGYESGRFLKKGLVALHSSYVLASKPVGPRALWRDACLIWETARPYFYIRTTADRRILIGGEDEPFANPRRRDAKVRAKRRILEGKFRRLFPKIKFKTEVAWAGTFGESPDGLPFIGGQNRKPRVLYALGYGGNGITFSQIAAGIIRDECLGRPNRDAALFRFDRNLKSR